MNHHVVLSSGNRPNFAAISQLSIVQIVRQLLKHMLVCHGTPGSCTMERHHASSTCPRHDFLLPPVLPLKLPSNPGRFTFLPLPACLSSLRLARFSVRFFCLANCDF